MARRPAGATRDPLIPEDIAARVQVAVDRSGITMTEIADRMGGLGRSNVWNVANGHQRPSLEWLWRFAQAVECDPHDLDPRLQATGAGASGPYQ